MPDSDSDAEEEGPFKGLTDSAMYVGEGPILYLQIMKTFAVMFFVLSLINLPMFLIYSKANDVSLIDSVKSNDWNKVTIGSLGYNL